MLYLDLEDLKQSQSDGGNKKYKINGETESHTPFAKSLLGASIFFLKEVGTPRVQSTLCTPQLALSTAVRNRVSKTESPAVET